MANEININKSESTVIGQEHKNVATTTTPVENKGNKLKWQKIAIGTSVGVVLGSVSAAIAKELSRGNDSKVVTDRDNVDLQSVDTEDTVIEVTDVDMFDLIDASLIEDLDTLPVADVDTVDMTFEQAFAAARNANGPGAMFEWHGNLYSTYTTEEWDNLDSASQENYAEQIEVELPAILSTPFDELPVESVTSTPASFAEPEIPVEQIEPEIASDELFNPDFDDEGYERGFDNGIDPLLADDMSHYDQTTL